MKLFLPIAKCGNPNRRAVTLTFDDGPNPHATPQILDILKRENCKATFFLIGQRAEEYPEIVRRILAEGHAIGGHTHKHGGDDGCAAWHEFELGNESLERISGTPIRYVRVPQFKYRKKDGGILRTAELLEGPLAQKISSGELSVIDCSLDSWDWISWIPGWALSLMVTLRLHAGAIICMHDGSQKDGDLETRAQRTVQILPELIRSIKAGGYEIVNLSEIDLRHETRRIEK